MEDLSPPIPAATLVLMRPAPGGPPELLVMERAGSMAFAAGALVFPGGRIDPGDRMLAERLESLPDAPARIAAIRETIEETGIAPALIGAEGKAALLREGLAKGEAFGDLLAAHGVRADLRALVPFARWCPNFKEARRFDTLFFLAEAPPGTPPAEADRAEAVRAFWASAPAILAEVDAGRAKVIFPTRRNLERLARFATIEEARLDAARHPVRRITPWVEERDGAPWLCIPDDAGYPVTAEPLSTVRRG